MRRITKKKMNKLPTPDEIRVAQEWERDAKKFNEGLQKLIDDTQVTIVPKIVGGEDGFRPVLRIARLTKAPAAKGGTVQVAPKPKKNAKSKKSD